MAGRTSTKRKASVSSEPQCSPEPRRSKRIRKTTGSEDLDNSLDDVQDFSINSSQIDPTNDIKANSSNHAESKDAQSGTISLSVEETNKLRESLGLPLLKMAEDDAAKDDDDDDGGEYKHGKTIHAPAVNIGDLEQDQKLKSRVEVYQENLENARKFSKIKSVSEKASLDDGIDNTKEWVDKLRKGKVSSYSSSEMVLEKVHKKSSSSKSSRKMSNDIDEHHQVKVAHSLERFKVGDDVILTLDDTDVLKDQEDVLVNLSTRDYEKAEESVKNRQGFPQYNPYDDGYDDETLEYVGKSLLSKYDDEIYGKKQKSFYIDSQRQEMSYTIPKPSLDSKASSFSTEGKIKISLNTAGLQIAQEYLAPEEISFKKKKKKVKTTRIQDSIRKVNSEAQSEFDDTEEREFRNIKSDTCDISLFDQELDEAVSELESALEKCRAMKTATPSVESQLISNLANQSSMMDLVKNEPAELESGASIVIDSIGEFVRYHDTVPVIKREFQENSYEGDEEDPMSRQDTSSKLTIDELNIPLPMDEESDEGTQSTINPVVLDEEQEPSMSRGLGSVLKMLQNKGYLRSERKVEVKKSTNIPETKAEIVASERFSNSRNNFASKKGNARDQRSGSAVGVSFPEKKDYKPDVKISYHDETGCELDPKEAFRHLSHKFHGKSCGKIKQAKRLQKRIDKQHNGMKTDSDAAVKIMDNIAAKQKINHTPYLVLTGGSKSVLNSVTQLSKK